MNRRCMGCMEVYNEEFDICPHCGYVNGTSAKEAYHITPGSVLQKQYIVGRVLGFGGFGITYIGYDMVLDHKVAIKEYMPSEFSTRMPNQQMVTVYSGDREEQFKEGLIKIIDEARRLANFASEPGIVHIYNCFEANNTAYIVMEYLDGESLKEKISRDGKMAVDEAQPIILAVLSALKKVHEAGIIHRDIAPDNIYLLKSGEVKLLDFGAARYATTKHSKSLSVIIKPGYAPEEQYRSRGDQGPWTDVYALAATFYKMLTGITPEEAMERSVKDELKRPSKLGVKIGKSTETALMNALNVKIQDRTQSAEAFEQELLAAEVKERSITKDRADLGQIPLWVKIASCAAAAAVASVMILLATGIIHFSIPGLTGDVVAEGRTLVPNIVNQEIDQAEESIKQAQLGMQITGWDASEEIEKGKILIQDPAGGNELDIESVISVKVSSGGAMTRVPDFVGTTRDEAEKAIDEAGLLAEFVEKEYQAAPGTIAEQSLEAYQQVKMGEKITLTVSKGLGDGDQTVVVKVEDVVGLDYDEASKRLYDNSYLYLMKSGSEYSDTIPEGQIISQQPAAGTEVNQQSNIRVTVSLGKEKVAVPNVTYITLEDARKNLEDAFLTVSVKEEYSDTVPKGNTAEQSIEEGQLVEKGTMVEVIVSLGKKPEETKASKKETTQAGQARTRPTETQPPAPQPAPVPTEPPAPAPTEPPTAAPTEPPTPPSAPSQTEAPKDTEVDLNRANKILNDL